jgi:hypothetical protein
MVLTLAALLSPAGDNRVSAVAMRLSSTSQAVSPERDPSIAEQFADVRPREAAPGRDNDSAESHPSIGAPQASDRSATSHIDPPRSSSSSPAATDNHGGGSGSTSSRAEHTIPSFPAGTNANKTSREGEASGGVGSPLDRASDRAAGLAGMRGGSSSRSIVAPLWQSAGWPQSVQRADDALRDQQIPAAYRDLVRHYFHRE